MSPLTHTVSNAAHSPQRFDRSAIECDPPSATLLQDRVIAVTGAGSGIGAVMAQAFAQFGATVVLLGRSVPGLTQTYDAITAAGSPTPAIIPLDLRHANDLEYTQAATAIERQLGRLDGLLHNAACFTRLTPMAHELLSDWWDMFRVNTFAPFALTRALLPLLRAAPDASILLTSETHTATPTAYWGNFSASRIAAEHAALSWADEWENTSVRVNVVVPGPVRSPSRARTHPGEMSQDLPAIDTLIPVYLYLMGPGSRAVRGQRIDLGPVGG